MKGERKRKKKQNEQESIAGLELYYEQLYSFFKRNPITALVLFFFYYWEDSN
jgi:hypothetical protein